MPAAVSDAPGMGDAGAWLPVGIGEASGVLRDGQWAAPADGSGLARSVDDLD